MTYSLGLQGHHQKKMFIIVAIPDTKVNIFNLICKSCPYFF